MRKLRLAVLLAVLVFSISNLGYCYWIWSPKTGKWINPKNEVKPDPKEQLAFAGAMYDSKDYAGAIIEFKKLIKHYPKSYEASEAQFFIGACHEKSGKLYEAYQAYQKVLDKYPFTKRTDEIIQNEFNIAEKFMDIKKSALGAAFTGENPAVEIYQKVIDNSKYSKLAPQAQYKLGLYMQKLSRYQEAQDEYEKLISEYPESEWVEPAKYQLAICLSKVSSKIGYDQKPSEEARQKFEEFVIDHPAANITKEAEEQISRIKDNEAKGNFKIAQFYEKQKSFSSAKLYYQDIIDNYPRTEWAAKALERLKELENKKK